MNREKIFEIFRACRLCGVGAGYKMPIIQNIIDIENEEIELRQKIKECVQIEVNLNEAMPPLICELCVDKIQDFYEFRKMCHETHRKTRQRLGLPLLTSKGVEASTNKERSRSSSVEVSIRGGKGQTSKKNPRRSELEELQELTSHASTSTRLRPAPKSIQRNVEREISDSESDASTSTRSKPAPRSVKRNLDISDTAESIKESFLVRPKTERARVVPLESTIGKKSRASMETSNPEKMQKAGPKSSKETAILTPPPKPPKPGPKSKKLDTTQMSQKIDTPKPKNDTDKSKKVELPASKSEVAKSKAKAGPKSKMRESSPVVQHKTKKAENVMTTASRGKKRDETSPAPRSKKQRDASPKPEQQFECKICDTKVKSYQGLSAHSKVHVVTYTASELACNACELWFPNATAAGIHTKQHTNGLPYTCNKCYDDFKTNDDYEMHFTRNQCIPTYEAADVKCDSCWKYFPTYKLLEEHKCGGEGARPGGKCSICKRVYATLKSLRTHEFRCTQKRKVEPHPEPKETPLDAAKGMLPMQVRIVRCDTLLAISDGHYDVSGLSNRFGLDRRSTYPYFYTMGNVKSEPSTSFNPMVAINDDIKQEYFKDDVTENSFVHWDSNSETNSETDDVSSPKSVRSLSNISLKTLFSPKCLGKVPKRQRKVKSVVYDSILSIDLKNINNKIYNLGHQSNHSGDDDSDSILDKNAAKNSSSLNENVVDNVEHSQTDDGIVETAKSGDDGSRMADAHDDNMNETEELDNKETLISENQVEICDPTNNSQETSKEEMSEPIQKDITRTENLSSSELLQNTNDTDPKEGIEESAKVAEESLSDCKTCSENGQVFSNEKVCEDKIVDAENNEVVTELQNPDVEMSEQQDELVSNNANKLDGSDTDSQVSEIIEPTDVSNGKQTEDSKDVSSEKVFENYDSTHVTNDKGDKSDGSSTNETVNDVTSIKENVNENDDSLHATNIKMDENDHLNEQDEETKNDTAEINNSKEDETYREDNTSRNLGESLIENESGVADVNNPSDDMTKEEDDTNKVKNSSGNSGESLITENDLFSPKNIQSVDKFNINNLDEDEKLLMAELDAQIGENLPENLNSESESQNNSNTFGENNINNYKSEVSGENSDKIDKNTNVIGDSANTGEFRTNSNHLYTKNDFAITNKGFEEKKTETLDALLNRGDDLKSLDLDSISDEEFNFDI